MRPKYHPFVVSFLSFLAVVSLAQSDWKPDCTDYKQCNVEGTKALQQGQITLAIRLFKLQAGYAEIADIEKGHVDMGPGKTPMYSLGNLAANNLTVAYMRKRNYIQARLWCREVLRWDKDNKAALYNLKQIEEKLKGWKWPESATGTYLQYAGRGLWSSLSVRQLRPDRLRVSYEGYRIAAGPESAHYGDFEATLAFKDGRATYRGDADFPNCRIRMDFAADKVILKQRGGGGGGCGFGHDVEASGEFERASISPTYSDY